MAESGTTQLTETSAIRLVFVVTQEDAGRPPVTFDAPTLMCCNTVTVRGSSEGGWVFCGTQDCGAGDFLVVQGGTAELIQGFSGDTGEVEFNITHDGVSSEVVVTYSTRAD